VQISTFPERPVLNGSWTVLILVDYPDPREVIPLPPPLPPSLSLEQVFTGGRILPGPGGEPGQWTAVEFSYILRRPGPLELAPFEIRAGGKRAFTPGIHLFVPGAGDSAGEEPGDGSLAFFRWETPPLPLTVGEAGEFALLLAGGDPKKPFPEGNPFRGKIPGELILETLPPEDPGRERGVVLRFRLIPLKAGDFELVPGLFHPEGFPEIPVLPVRVRGAPERPGPGVLGREGKAPPEKAGPGTSPARPAEELPAFPPGEEPVFFLLRAGYEGTRQNARELWEGGNRAEALATLRRGERDLLSGPLLASVRRDAERVLALEPGENEKWRPRILLGFLGTGSFILLLAALGGRFFSSSLVFLGKKDVTSPRVRRYKGVILFLTVIFVAALFGLGEGIIRRAKPGRGPERGGRGVLRTAVARPVPDLESGVSVRFGEGQSVIVRGASNGWVYVESPGGRTGWVTGDRVIMY
jgi:hypothetical protein